MGPLGILGGGQLGRMTLQAASRLGIDVVIAERVPDSPAARLTDRSIVFIWTPSRSQIYKVLVRSGNLVIQVVLQKAYPVAKTFKAATVATAASIVTRLPKA